jgi:hypothetical protein
VSSGASIAGVGSITDAGVNGRQTGATITGLGVITSAGTVVAGGGGAVNIIGTASVVTTGRVGAFSATSISGVGSVITTGSVGVSRGASISGVGSVTAAGVVYDPSGDRNITVSIYGPTSREFGYTNAPDIRLVDVMDSREISYSLGDTRLISDGPRTDKLGINGPKGD